MGGSKWLYHTYDCEFCSWKDYYMVERKNVPNEIFCPICDHVASRRPSGNILKKEIEEKTHGGVVNNGKEWRQYTGFKEMAEQNKLEQELRRTKRRKNPEGALDALKELKAKRKG